MKKMHKLFNFLFPFSSIVVLTLLGLLLKTAIVNNERPILFSEWLILMCWYFVIIILPYDLIRWLLWGKKKYLKKHSITETYSPDELSLHAKAKMIPINVKHAPCWSDKSKQLTLSKDDARKKATLLIDRAKEYCSIINNTTDRDVFELYLERLKTVLMELITYEKYDIFPSITPTEDLNELLTHEDDLRETFEERLLNSKDESINQNTDTLFTEQAPITIKEPVATPFIKRAYMNEKELRQFALKCNYELRKEDCKSPAGIIVFGDTPKAILYENSENTEGVKTNNSSVESLEIHHIYNYESMSGHEFEQFCADILKGNGFNNVTVTQGSGDHGIDILAEKDDITYAIQCKCYSNNVGNDAIQQALAGKKFYKRDIAVVLTNQHFTPQAREEAAVFGVKLWDRDKLDELIQNINK